MVIVNQNCSKERLICIVKLFSDAWSSLTAVVEFFLQTRRPSCRPTNRTKALKGLINVTLYLELSND